MRCREYDITKYIGKKCAVSGQEEPDDRVLYYYNTPAILAKNTRISTYESSQTFPEDK